MCGIVLNSVVGVTTVRRHASQDVCHPAAINAVNIKCPGLV